MDSPPWRKVDRFNRNNGFANKCGCFANKSHSFANKPLTFANKRSPSANKIRMLAPFIENEYLLATICVGFAPWLIGWTLYQPLWGIYRPILKYIGRFPILSATFQIYLPLVAMYWCSTCSFNFICQFEQYIGHFNFSYYKPMLFMFEISLWKGN
jgi:hypothetical protein